MNRIIGLALMVAALGACKKDDQKSATQPAASAEKSAVQPAGKAVEAKADNARAAVAIDVTAVNALVPKELADKLSFSVVSVDKGKFQAVVPTGWKESEFIPGSFEAPSGMGFTTNVRVSTNCDGECKPKDWAQVSDKVNFAQLIGNGNTVDKDEKSEGHRVLRASNGDKVFIVEAWWAAGDKEYLTCNVTLDGDVKAAAAAFEKACSLTQKAQ